MTATAEEISTEVLRVPDFRRLWMANGLRGTAGEIAGFALPVTAVTMLGASPLQMGFIAMCGKAGYLLVGLPAGVWIDRWPKRSVLLTAEVGYTVALASIPLAYFMGVLTIVHFMVVALVLSVAGVFFSIAHTSVLPLLLPKKRVADAKARLETADNTISTVSPAIAGAVSHSVAAPVLYGAAATFQFFSATLIRRMKPSEPVRLAKPERHFRKEVADGVRIVVGQPLLRLLLGQTALNNLGAGIIMSATAYFLLKTLGIEPWLFGVLSSLAAVSGLAASLVCPALRRRIGEIRMTMVFSGLAPLAMVTIPLAGVFRGQAVVLVAVSQVLLGVVLVGRSVAAAGLRARVTPNRYLSRVTAASGVVTQGATPFGALLGGLIAGVWSAQVTLWVGVAVMTTPIILLLTSPLRTHRTLPPEWEVDD
ncbi:MFS transporter [Nocardia cyriacigeorgica]|uniref:MFS transporter n=1 Tax=Nocardia cyriacigeorgica TaxID=135487 RepID=UPI0024541BD3|nr:MFS transporter [Nocardia cyriacigeorgica]